jgi:hypothetical protein
MSNALKSLNGDLLGMAMDKLTGFHGGVNVSCKRCKKIVYEVGKVSFMHAQNKQFQASNFCLASESGMNQLVLVPENVLLVDAGSVIRMSNSKLGGEGFHSGIFGMDEHYCGECCTELRAEDTSNKKKFYNMKKMMCTYNQVVKQNADTIKDMRELSHSNCSTLAMHLKCMCVDIGGHEGKPCAKCMSTKNQMHKMEKCMCVEIQGGDVQPCNKQIAARYSTHKVAEVDTMDTLRVVFMPLMNHHIDNTNNTDQPGLYIWIINTLTANAVRYSPGYFKATLLKRSQKLDPLANGREPNTSINAKGALISQCVIAPTCWEKPFNNIAHIAKKNTLLSCAACGEGMFGGDSHKLVVRNMVWMQGYLTVVHLDTCTQTCVICNDALVPRYGGSGVKTGVEDKAEMCVPLACSRCATLNNRVFQTLVNKTRDDFTSTVARLAKSEIHAGIVAPNEEHTKTDITEADITEEDITEEEEEFNFPDMDLKYMLGTSALLPDHYERLSCDFGMCHVPDMVNMLDQEEKSWESSSKRIKLSTETRPSKSLVIHTGFVKMSSIQETIASHSVMDLPRITRKTNGLHQFRVDNKTMLRIHRSDCVHVPSVKYED